MLARRLQCRPELEDASRAPVTTVAESQTEWASLSDQAQSLVTW
jgi:hypothetical protein